MAAQAPIGPMSTNTIRYLGRDYLCRGNESVLEALIRQGAPITFSCQKGSCAACMQRCVDGTIPSAATKHIRAELTGLGYFLPCMCHPTGDLVITPPDPEHLYFGARVADKQALSEDVCRLRLEPWLNVTYKAGQFINLKRPDGLIRSYSLASVFAEDALLEVHVKRVDNGAVSAWIHDDLEVEEEVRIQGPNGDNFYRPLDLEQPLVLIATGTGVAPMYGIARTAVHHGHRGEIRLYHQAETMDGLYLNEELNVLADAARNFRYFPITDEGSGGLPSRALPDQAIDACDAVKSTRFHMAGRPSVIRRALALLDALGVGRDGVFYDAFLGAEESAAQHHEPADLKQSATRLSSRRAVSATEIGPRHLPPDPELWAALGEGKLLNRILTEFYDAAFEDVRLSPYFQGVTKTRLIEKVYSFLRQMFTGEKLYFGNRPRNAHHWMVISDELFDYRESLLVECMRRAGLAEPMVERWRRVEERYRGDIVKDEPWNRIVDGFPQPVDGYGHEIISVATLCDGCGDEVAAGEKVSYHRRLGTVACARCSGGEEAR